MDVITELAILALAAFVGFEVISKVPNTLHTPLMSGTNAIHGIVLMGGLLVLSSAAGALNKLLLVIAITFGTIYIVAFTLFIVGLRGLAGPRTAPLGNRLAAVGMFIALVATLLIEHVIKSGSDVALMALGIGIGTTVGIPAARGVKMTAMPQMVALFNGVGGGAVALIAWVEYRRRFPEGGQLWNLKAEIPSLFAAIVGSISFWGSNIAFGKLQEILPGRPIQLPGQRVVNALLGVVAITSAVVLASGVHSQALFIGGILVAAAILGNMVV